MQVTVPQFIDVESKIIGPISARQFIIGIVGFFIEYLIFSLGTTLSLLIFGPIVLGLVILFAFVKINGQMFHIFVLNVLTTLKRPKLRLWHREIDHWKKEKAKKASIPFQHKSAPGKSRLKELSLIVDTGGTYAVDRSKRPQFDFKP